MAIIIISESIIRRSYFDNHHFGIIYTSYQQNRYFREKLINWGNMIAMSWPFVLHNYFICYFLSLP